MKVVISTCDFLFLFLYVENNAEVKRVAIFNVICSFSIFCIKHCLNGLWRSRKWKISNGRCMPEIIAFLPKKIFFHKKKLYKFFLSINPSSIVSLSWSCGMSIKTEKKNIYFHNIASTPSTSIFKWYEYKVRGEKNDH